MRNRFAVIVVIAALASATTISVTGQEDPLPRVTPRGAAAPALQQGTTASAQQSTAWQSDLLVVLPLDPIHVEPTVTLAEAARQNDYATFHALYTKAREQGRDVAAYASLNDLWTFAVTDPIGGFFSGERFERLARAYPGFRGYMDTYRIVDSRGHVFYPTSEAREFLLTEALRGTEPAGAVVAEPRSGLAQPERQAARSTPRRASRPAATPRRSPRPLQDWSAAAKSAAPVKTVQPAAKPATETATTPATSVPTTASTPSTQTSASATESVAAPVDTASSTLTAPPVTDSVTTSVPAPVTAEPVPAVQPAAEPAPSQPSATGRGLLLLVIGLIGVGILALMLRTPREEMPRSIIDHSVPEPPKDGEKPHATVEPIRKRTSKPTPPTPPRQTGTHS